MYAHTICLHLHGSLITRPGMSKSDQEGVWLRHIEVLVDGNAGQRLGTIDLSMDWFGFDTARLSINVLPSTV